MPLNKWKDSRDYIPILSLLARERAVVCKKEVGVGEGVPRNLNTGLSFFLLYHPLPPPGIWILLNQIYRVLFTELGNINDF